MIPASILLRNRFPPMCHGTGNPAADRCLRELRYLAGLTCSSVAERVPAALDGLEAECGSIPARARGLRAVRERLRTGSGSASPFQRFVVDRIGRRLRGLGV